MNLHTRPVRLLLATGAVVVAGTSTFVALAGTAAADEPGRCLQNVNVREYPTTTSRIVALCEAGTQVVTGEERDGWVRLEELDGWAAAGYVEPGVRTASTDRAEHPGDDGSAPAASEDLTSLVG